MTSKTPQFDKALADYFADLKLDEQGGQWRTCRLSGQQFYVRPEDIAFYKRIGVPLPTLHSDERWRRLIAYQNSYNLFRVKSAMTGDPIIAAYPPDTPYRIYEHTPWYAGEWDAFAFGKTYDPTKGFFEQWGTLQKEVPRPSLMNDSTNVNSDYTNLSTNLKDSYLAFNSFESENIYYMDGGKRCRDCIYGNAVTNCDTCYRSRVLYDSFRCFFCEESRNCSESYFLFDCRNCENCFMCANLRNKKYCFENKQLSKDEYEKRLRSIDLGTRETLLRYQARFTKMCKDAYYKPDHNLKSVQCIGDFLINCRSCTESLYLENAENVHYSIGLLNYKDSHDVCGGRGGELCYGLMTVSTKDNYNVRCSSQVDGCRDVEYSDLCQNCHDCFGCIGLSNKAFCIFNKQYTEKDYWSIVDSVKTNMLSRGEYGEFFPARLAPVPYKLSFALSYGSGFDDFENAKKYDYDVSEPPALKDDTATVLSSEELPKDIKKMNDDITQVAIFDEQHKKYFRITPYELNFNRRLNIAFRAEHPLEQLRELRSMYPLRLRLFSRECPKCHNSFRSVHDPQERVNVLCEACYNAEVA